MAVRVEVIVLFRDIKVESVALANAGYETDRPELLVPVRLAKKYWPNLLASAPVASYQTAGGPVDFRVLGEAVVQVVCADKVSRCVKTLVVASRLQDECLLNDKLVGRLGLDLVDPGTGRWRFRDESARQVRRSKPPQRW